MKKIILATGIYYECGSDDALCRQTLEHLDTDRPLLILVEEYSPEFGTIVGVREETVKRASVSRFDLDTVLFIMRNANRKSMTAMVHSVNFDERTISLEITLADDAHAYSSAIETSSWQWDGPIMDLPQSMQDTRTAINVLDMALSEGSNMDSDTIKSYIVMLTDNCRCDVSFETFESMKDICTRIEHSSDLTISAYHSHMMHTMITLGSAKRMEEFALWWHQLRNSDEAFDMTRAWIESQPYATDDRETASRIDSELVRIDLSLRKLPLRLYRNISNMATFMHQMIYLSFTRDAIQSLFSELILREMLLERRLEYKLHPSSVTTESAPDMTNPVWQDAIDEGWLNDDLQPLLSRSQAALLAFYISKKLKIHNKWKFFERLWNRRNMKNDYYAALDQRQTSAMLDRIKDVIGT